MKKISIHEAIGMTLCHDITKIVPGKEKVRAFQRGHIICPADIPLLQDLGKEHIYVWEESENMVHEDDAALRLAQLASGSGIIWNTPNQGKVSLMAEHSGLLEVNASKMEKINAIEGIVLASLHSGRVVSEGTLVAGTRIIPLAIERNLLEKAEKACCTGESLISIKPFLPLRIGIVTTGNEVYHGRIQDGFCSVLQQKVAPYNAELLRQVIVPDDSEAIAREILKLINDGAQLVFVTGGMSIDPDDVSPTGIKKTGAEVAFYGVPVLPGSMLMLAYLDGIPICGIPGCVMFNGVTSLDLILPYLFAGQRVSRSQIVSLGHGGLCQECQICQYPNCSFCK